MNARRRMQVSMNLLALVTGCLLAVASPWSTARADAESQTTAASSRERSFDLEPFKFVELPNLFELPGYANLSIPVYRSSGKAGPGILLVHGNSTSARSYVRQVFSALGRTFRLYLIDLPGFGLSEKVAPDRSLIMLEPGLPIGFAEYQIGMMEAVAAVAADPELAPKVFVGWSVGADVVVQARGLGLLPEARGLFLFGFSPRGARFTTQEFTALPPFLPGFPGAGQAAALGVNRRLDPTSVRGFSITGAFTDPVPDFVPPPLDDSANVGELFVRALFRRSVRESGRVPDFFLEDALVRADERARTSLSALALPTPAMRRDALEVLSELAGEPDDPTDDIPVALVVGREDAFLNPQYLLDLAASGVIPTLWGGQVVQVPGAGHAIHFEQPARFNGLLARFVAQLRR